MATLWALAFAHELRRPCAGRFVVAERVTTIRAGFGASGHIGDSIALYFNIWPTSMGTLPVGSERHYRVTVALNPFSERHAEAVITKAVRRPILSSIACICPLSPRLP